MRSIVSTLLLGTFLSSATSCAPEDICGAAAKKISECKGSQLEALASCDPEAAELVLATSCDRLDARPGKAIAPGIAIGIAAVLGVVGYAAMSFFGEGNEAQATTAGPPTNNNPHQSSAVPATSPASSPHAPATSPASAVTTALPYPSAAPVAVSTAPAPVHVNAPATLPTNTPATLPTNPVASVATTPSAGPAELTNAKGCEGPGNGRQCVGNATGRAFQWIPQNALCRTGGSDYRLCRTGAGECGVEFCWQTSRAWANDCSVDMLATLNAAWSTPPTVDGRPLRCATTQATANAGPQPAMVPCYPNPCRADQRCTPSGCVPNSTASTTSPPPATSQPTIPCSPKPCRADQRCTPGGCVPKSTASTTSPPPTTSQPTGVDLNALYPGTPVCDYSSQCTNSFVPATWGQKCNVDLRCVKPHQVAAGGSCAHTETPTQPDATLCTTGTRCRNQGNGWRCQVDSSPYANLGTCTSPADCTSGGVCNKDGYCVQEHQVPTGGSCQQIDQTGPYGALCAQGTCSRDGTQWRCAR